MKKPSPPPPSDPLKWFVFVIFDGVTETTDSLKYVRATSTVKHITPVMVHAVLFSLGLNYIFDKFQISNQLKALK